MAQMLQQARMLHQRNQLEQAEYLYREALEQAPENADVLHRLGVCVAQRGNASEGAKLIGQALTIDRSNAIAHNNLGIVLQDLGRTQEALASFIRAVTLKPAYADAYNNIGNTLSQLGRIGEAMKNYAKAIELSPRYADAHNNLGNALAKLGRLDDALASYAKAINARPDFTAAHNNLGNLLMDLGRLDDALRSYDKAIHIDPKYAEAHGNRGSVLRELRRSDEALASFDLAIALKPLYPEAHNNRGNALRDLGFLEKAIASYTVAIKLKPDYAEAYNNLGNALKDLGRYKEALQKYARALALRADYVDASWNEALCRLSMGDFRRGWEKYECRWSSKHMQNRPRRSFQVPIWRGNEDLRGKSIFLWAEQGLGDTIQFCRYIQVVAQREARITFEVQPSLKRLLHGLDGLERILVPGDPLPKSFDYHCPLLSLPLAFKTELKNIPDSVPYIYADPSRVAYFHKKLGTTTRPRVGLVWSGAATDPRRSVPLQDILESINANINWISLQKEVQAEDRSLLERSAIVDVSQELTDFYDTAALVQLMDCVVSVDTSVAHLAGAMGKRTWVMLPYSADWRWLSGRQDSPWYPTMRLFRQSLGGGWKQLVRELMATLEAELHGSKARGIMNKPRALGVLRRLGSILKSGRS